MKCLSVLVFAAAIAFGQAPAPRTVYILPMAGGLDQYLAQWLTRDHIMQVVADPKIADTVLTDRLGEAFEQRLAEMQASGEKKSQDASGTTHNAFHASRARGTVFLVDAKSRHVIWSDHEKTPGSNSDSALNREAEHIAKKLQLR